MRKAKKFDERIGLTANDEGSVQARMDAFAIRGIAVGPCAEVSPSLRELLEPVFEARAEKILQSRGILGNAPQGQLAASLYDAFRRRFGMLVHKFWAEIQMQTVGIVHWEAPHSRVFDSVEVATEIHEDRGDEVDVGLLGV